MDGIEWLKVFGKIVRKVKELKLMFKLWLLGVKWLIIKVYIIEIINNR
jgi:hypothetical protein